MKTYFIIHGSFGDSKEHYLPWLKSELEKLGEVICEDFPIGVGKQKYDSWSKVLDKYKDKINEESVFIGRSIGPIFAIKYLINNDLHIDKLFSVSGFNKVIVDGGDYDIVNSTMFVDNLKDFKKYCKQTTCIISENADSGYGEKFEELLKEIKEWKWIEDFLSYRSKFLLTSFFVVKNLLNNF